MASRLKSRALAAGLLSALLVGGAHAQLALGEVPGGGMAIVQVRTWRDIPFRDVVRQQYDYSCGSAALATLLRYHYGMATDEAHIFRAMYASGDQAKIRQVGFSLLDMKRYLVARGLTADGYRATFDQLRAMQSPAIAVVSVGRYRHFVVLKGVRGDRVLIGDPALGLKTYSRAEFEAVWNHIIFAIHDDTRIKGAFNQEAEWRPWATAPLGTALDPKELGFIRELPPLYQVAQIRTIP